MPRLPTVILLSLLTWTATAGALTLTDDERSWLADHQELRLGVDASWPPFEYRDEMADIRAWLPITYAYSRTVWAFESN